MNGPRLRDRWITAVLRSHRLVLIAAALVTALALHLTSRLRVDSDLRALLPADDPALLALDRVERSLGTLGSINVLVAGGDVAGRHALADALADALAASPGVRAVEHRVPGSFFAEHALYYLGDAEFDALDEHLQAWQHHELCAAEPDLCLSPPDPKAPEALRELLRRHEAAARARVPFRDYFEREDLPALVMLVHPTHSSSDLEFSKRISAEARARVAEVLARPGAPWGDDVRVNLVGPYIVKADEHATIRADMLRGALFGALGVLLVLHLLLRSTRAVVMLMIPLACGVAWSMAVAQLVLGHLNSLTSLISTVIMGMGIDAGIHLFMRIRAEPAGVPDHEAIARAFGELITPLLVASGTTLAAFCVMACSSFPAFREFGLIAAAGVVCCLLAMLTVYPAALRLGGVRRAGLPRPAGAGALARLLLRRPGRVLAGVAALTIVAGALAGRVAFENNSREFQSTRTRAQGEADAFLIREILGHDVHAGVLVVDTLDEAREVVRRARAALAADPGTLVEDVFAAPDLLPDPAIDAEQRRLRIAALAEDIPESFWSRDDLGEEVARLRRMLVAGPVALERLPPELLAKVRGADGSFPVYAFPAYDAADIARGANFIRETASFAGDRGGPRDFVGEMTVYVRMVGMTMAESPLVLAAAAGLIALVVLLQLRSLALTLLTLLPLGLGLLWLLAAMVALDVRFTLFNIPILPVILGIGVDNGVYLTDHIRRTRGAPGGLAEALGGTGAAILAATATTAVGFGAFMIADNGGLRSIGVLAVLGTLIAALAAVLVLPALVAACAGRRRD